MSQDDKPQKQGRNRPPVEGEGNRTADADYRERTKRFIDSGKVDEKAKEARRALEGEEGDELREADEEGRSHAAEEDPQVVLDRRRKGVGTDNTG